MDLRGATPIPIAAPITRVLRDLRIHDEKHTAGRHLPQELPPRLLAEETLAGPQGFAGLHGTADPGRAYQSRLSR